MQELLEHVLMTDPERRYTPRQALEHPFITDTASAK